MLRIQIPHDCFNVDKSFLILNIHIFFSNGVTKRDHRPLLICLYSVFSRLDIKFKNKTLYKTIIPIRKKTIIYIYVSSSTLLHIHFFFWKSLPHSYIRINIYTFPLKFVNIYSQLEHK